jgi:hypothetical protein
MGWERGSFCVPSGPALTESLESMSVASFPSAVVALSFPALDSSGVS